MQEVKKTGWFFSLHGLGLNPKAILSNNKLILWIVQIYNPSPGLNSLPAREPEERYAVSKSNPKPAGVSYLTM